MSNIGKSKFAITGNMELALTSAHNNRRLIRLRWWYLTFICLVALASSFVVYEGAVFMQDYLLILLAGLVINGLFYAAVRLRPSDLFSQQLITIAQLAFDLAMVGLATFVQGGVEARVTILYAIPILASALLFGSRTVILTTALSSATYVAALLLEDYINQSTMGWAQLIVPMIFYPAVFFLIGRIALYFQHLNTQKAREQSYDSFLSLVGHQLKHPSSAVATIIDGLRHNEAAKLDEATKHYIDLLKTENNNQIRLIDNLLEAAPENRREIYNGSVDVSKLIDKIAQRVAEANDRIADLDRMGDHEEGVMVRGSEIRLGLALTNVFDNAFRYSDAGSPVRFEVTAKAGKATIIIRDSGLGMDNEEVVRQSKRLDVEGIRGIAASGHLGGLGLGLYATHRIIKNHGGKLRIHSSDKIGTTIIITLERSSKHV